ncbi:TAP42-like protein [Crassisporium funariophilum]|nr:TAP42-like protein [Crassisporium funariophilum]
MSPPALFNRVLGNASRAANLPTIADEAQELIAGCVKDLQSLHSQIVELSMFSPNETLEDISTRDLVYLTVPYVFAEVQGRVMASNRIERLNSLIQAEKFVQGFISLLDRYEIVPQDERALYERKTANVADMAKRRELKINQYKKEKELRGRIEVKPPVKIRKDRGQNAMVDDTPTDFDLISSLLPSSAPKGIKHENEEADSETDENLRESTLLLLRLFYTRACTQLQSMEQELDLLRNAPPSPIHGPTQGGEDPRDKQRQLENDTWKLDIPVAGGPDGKGPLLDPTGKPLRPFTILPSDAGERARLQAQVFGPGHRLPSMSVDEYLEIERQRGNIITGGGPASQAAPTSSEQLAIDSEMDGTAEGETKAEEKRQKDENWARYTDENPKGAGNTMNRG